MSQTIGKDRRYTTNRVLLLVFDLVWVFLAAVVAFWVCERSIYEWVNLTTPALIWALVNVAVSLLLFAIFHFYHMAFSSVGFPEAIRIFTVCFVLTVVNAVFSFIWGRDIGLGLKVIAVYGILLFSGTVSIRFSKRIFNVLKTQFVNRFTKKTHVLIVGFNSDAFTLIRTMVFNEKSRYKAICIVDDDERVQGKRIYDVRVVGTTFDVLSVVEKYKIQEIFVALPTMNKNAIRDVLFRCKESGCPIRLLPELSKMTHGEISVSKLRHVDVADLLGREQVSVNLEEVMGYIEGKIVLVTGGGGSIGSELCRQIAMHKPEELIVLDIYENNAYDIEQELKRHYPDLKLLTLIASVRDEIKMRDVFDKYRPQIVFNAAAHKHVPLMETSPNEAVKNNVFGTLNVARAADEFGVETFVQISTDKAVNPTNIMGATKRICEMIIQTIGRHSKHTKFVAVRFGNVLGSNGSVIPLFRKQIKEGGPVTITHKDIIRYFMTIPEAVSLVLQAGAYAKGGQIFVLDMGEPVKIYDLAYNLIKLSGFEPNVDIQIECTGLRPGEKLFEERLMAEEGLQKTPNGLISIAQPIEFDEASLWESLDRLYEEAHSESEKMKEWVKVLVPTYTIDKRESVAVNFLRNVAKEKEEENAPVSTEENA